MKSSRFLSRKNEILKHQNIEENSVLRFHCFVSESRIENNEIETSKWESMFKIEIERIKQEHEDAYVLNLTDSSNPLYHFDFGVLKVKEQYFEQGLHYNPMRHSLNFS